jgi:hypothetical protein
MQIFRPNCMHFSSSHALHAHSFTLHLIAKTFGGRTEIINILNGLRNFVRSSSISALASHTFIPHASHWCKRGPAQRKWKKMEENTWQKWRKTWLQLISFCSERKSRDWWRSNDFVGENCQMLPTTNRVPNSMQKVNAAKNKMPTLDTNPRESNPIYVSLP